MPIAVDKGGAVVYLADDGAWKPAQTARNPQTDAIVAWDGKSWVEAIPSSRSARRTPGQLVDDVGRSLAQGATFGFADEIAAAADTAFGTGAGKPTYDENLAAQQARNKEIPAAISVPGEVAGGVASTLATAPVTVPMATASGLTRLPAWMRYVGTGAGTGGLYGAGEAQPGERLAGAGQGAVIGGAAGAAVPAVMATGARVGRELQGAVSPQANVAADLGRAIRRDETTPQALVQRAQELQTVRPGIATVADAGGENVRGLVERIAQTPGAGRTTVVPALTQRQQGQMARISNDLRGLTGTTRTANQAIEETMTQRAEAARPLYDEAMNFNARDVPEVVQAFANATSSGWGRSLLVSPNFRRTLQTEYGIQDPTQAPLMVVIDAWKKQADDLVNSAMREGNGNKARVIGEMRDRVVSVLDQHNPAYARARDAWAGPSRYLDAIEEGRNVLNTRISADDLNAALRNMSDAEREAFRVGAVSSIIGRMGSDPARMADMTKYLRSPEARAKIAALMPDDEARQAWQQRLDFEVSSSELTGRSLGNSATARRLAERQDADSIVGDLVMDAFSGAPPVSLVRRFIGAIPQRVRDTLRSRSDDVLAEMLTDPNSLQGLVRAMDRVQARSQPPSVLRRGAAITGVNAELN